MLLVPPGSTALREFCHAVARALTVPDPAIRSGTRSDLPADEAALLRLRSDRVQLVLQTMRRVLADREIDDRDVMNLVVSLREQTAGHPDGDIHLAGRP
jgi:hypothetical protein